MHFYLQQKGAPKPPAAKTWPVLGAVELGGGSGAGFQARLSLHPKIEDLHSGNLT